MPMPKSKRKAATAKPRKPAGKKPNKVKAKSKATTPAPLKPAKSKGEFVPNVNYASLPEGQFGTTLLAEFASGYRVLVAPFDDNDISIATERDSSRTDTALASGLGRFGKMNIE